MSTPPPVAYRYTVRFPSSTDAQRPVWPAGVLNRFNALPDLADLSFGEDVSAWTRPRAEDVRIESRVQVIELVTVSVDAAAAEAARVKVFSELERLRTLGNIGMLVIVRSTVEAYGLPPDSLIVGPTRTGF